MESYLDSIYHVLNDGIVSGDRTGTGTTRVPCIQSSYDLAGGAIPLLTTKQVFIKSVIRELAWFVRGETNIDTLGCGIWDEWASEEGELGPIYGKQWRKWSDTKIVTKEDWKSNIELYTERGYIDVMGDETRIVLHRCIDQLQRAVDMLKADPDSRRVIVSAWNVGDLEDMALMPCHSFFQFISNEMTPARRLEHYMKLVSAGSVKVCRPTDIEIPEGEELAHKLFDQLGVARRELHCILYQRSGDMFLGVPFNIASYSYLTLLMAHLTGHEPGGLHHLIGDAHVYSNHMNSVDTQSMREPVRHQVFYCINPNVKNLDEVTETTFIQLNPYIHYAPIKAKVAV